MSINICQYTHVNIHLSTYICQHTYVNIHLSTYICQHTYVNIHMSTYICQHTYVNIHTVDEQIIQSPHPWVVGYPLSPQISTLCFRIFVPDLRVWFISSIRRSDPNQKNNIVIGGAGGYWVTRVWIIRPSTVRGAVVSRSAENVKGKFS